MLKRRLKCLSYLAFALSLTSSLEAKQAAKNTIDIWTRKGGLYSEGRENPRLKSKTINLAKISLKKFKIYDSQYKEVFEYKGSSIVNIVKSYKHTQENDMILLHFSNGMLIPIPLEKDLKTLKTINPILAYKIKLNGTTKFTSDFPALAKKSERFKDPRPLTFLKNKIVVSNPWHPFVPGYTKKLNKNPKRIEVDREEKFSPWLYISSLTGIEFVNQDAYEKQFQLKKPLDNNTGYKVFKSRCQYCHGLLMVGANFGWDFLDPIPIYKLKQARHIYNHVKYKYHDSLEKGLLMPEQKDITRGEAYTFWAWLKEIDKQGLQAYKANWNR